MNGTLLTNPFVLHFKPDNERDWQIPHACIHTIERKPPTAQGLYPLYISYRHFFALKAYFATENDCARVYALIQSSMNTSTRE